MSTTGTERHCRLCLMLNKGGTKACHHLLLKRVKELSPKDHDPYPWTVQQFLDTKKQTIIKSKLSKDKFKIMFPNDGDTVLTKWDLSLFCTVLTLYCDLKPILRLDVEQLRNLRNVLCHMNEPNISVSDYEDKLEMIQVILCRLVEKIDEHNVKIEIENVIKNLESATLSIDETLKEMHVFYMMEMDIREKLDHVEERILQKLEQFDDKWELINKVLGEKEVSRISTATNNGLVPGVNIFLDLKNVSEDEEAYMSDVLQQLFEEVIHEDNDFKSSIPAETYVRLRGAIEKTFKRFLSKGWRITGVKHECIQLHIECTSFTALAALFREQTHGLIDQQLTDLHEALTECVCEKMLLLETTIYTDELWNVIDKAMSCVEDALKEHNIDMANQNDNAQLLCEDSRKHSLSLSAEKVESESSESFEGDCDNKLATFLQLLKAELKSEFHMPHLSIKANVSTNVNRAFNDEEGEFVEKVRGLSFKEIEPTIGSRFKQKEHTSLEKREITGQVKMEISTAISLESTATDSKKVARLASVETEGDVHNNAILAIFNSLNAISVYFELASLTLIESERNFLLSVEMEVVQRLLGDNIFRRIQYAAIEMNTILRGSALNISDLVDIYKGILERSDGQIEQNITALKSKLQNLETRLELKSSTEQIKNQTKAGYYHLHHLLQLFKDEELLLQEWQRDFKDSIPLSKEGAKQTKEVEDRDMEGDKMQFSRTHLAGNRKIYADLATLKLLTRYKKRPTEKHRSYERGTVLKYMDEKALTEMLRPGPALLGEGTDLRVDEQKTMSYFNILVSDPLFERDSNIVEDIKAFLSELTEHRETKLTGDPNLQGKIDHALGVSRKEPGEDELKRSMSLKQQKEKDREDSEPIKAQDKQISTASLQLRSERTALWCIQQIQAHFECMVVQLKRIKLSLSRLHTSLLHIENKIFIPNSLDRPTLTKEWIKVNELARHCRNSNDMLERRRRLSTYYERQENLRTLVKELETYL